MVAHPLIFDIQNDIELISHAVTERQNTRAFDPVIITRKGEYYGLLSVISLLKSITDIRILEAIDCNPLSHLPGNNRINHEIDRRLKEQQAFMLVYADLDSFKAYNDHYGYERGDRVIQWLAKILIHTAESSDFIGHVGGDDFVMILTPDHWKKKLNAMLDQFAQETPELYNRKDREKDCIMAENRQGIPTEFPFISLSLAVIPCPIGAYTSHVSVAESASEMKHLAKKKKGNSIAVDRRNIK